MPAPVWDMHDRTTEEQARTNRGRVDDGKISAVEDTAAPNDGNDVSVRMASGGVVHDVARPYASAGRSGECSHGGHDRCICGVAGARKGKG